MTHYKLNEGLNILVINFTDNAILDLDRDKVSVVIEEVESHIRETYFKITDRTAFIDLDASIGTFIPEWSLSQRVDAFGDKRIRVEM